MSWARWGSWIAGIAALLGAAGVALAAAAAHGGGHPSLPTAANFLILHGAGALALVASSRGAAAPRAYVLAATLMVLGVMLFSGDLTARAMVGDRLFPFAAPTGGALLICAWLVGGVAGFVGAFARRG
ncbi:hypothetical protein W911_10015 [Hyphomicrobium nitrativorans NL23]|uniref:DUF423 domain-containing protein n=1 Tax=Hyphomicrobium nitrativorans NL23 TaxID=1029756 RepID=V5SDP4_9HYPH|nr:DUF423 domain-containing protein [Hyphomicrobium nitrativorans]AHB48648.1 hypothetical protein W911_10015 [Hyphomicrobium nitrativorans NL23]